MQDLSLLEFQDYLSQLAETILCLILIALTQIGKMLLLVEVLFVKVNSVIDEDLTFFNRNMESERI